VIRLSLNLPLLVCAQQMREAQELERLWLAATMRPSALGGEPAELDQARLRGVELQAELREPVAEICPEPQRVAPVLESHHEVIGLCRVSSYADELLESSVIAGFGS